MLDEPSHRDGTVGKALSVLDEVAAHGRPIRFTDLLVESNYPKATLYRLLKTLCSQQMLDYDPDSQTYSLGARLVRLAHSAWRNFSLATVAGTALDALAAKLQKTVHLAQLDNGQVLYIDKRNPADPIEMFSSAGKVGPAYCTGVGKAMLSALEPAALDRAVSKQAFHVYTDQTLATPEMLREELIAIRDRGFAYDHEEHEPTIICVAVPILGRDQSVLGGLSTTSSTRHTTLEAMADLVPDLKSAAEQIAAAARSWRFPAGPGSD